MIYLDHAATTPLLPCVRDAIAPWVSGEKFGNASAIYTQGKEARAAVEEARAFVAQFINAKPNEIIFTSGGTESDNTAICGMIPYLKAIGKPVVVMSAIEHPALLKLITLLELDGIRVELIGVNSHGEVNLIELSNLLEHNDVGLVSIMLANNEIGVMQNMQIISEICHRHNCILHTDAVQAVGHSRVDVRLLGIDMLSISGHKIGAMQGIGALYVKSSVRPYLKPHILGGGQEKGLRSGTENVPGIVSLGTAACHMTSNWMEYTQHYISLRDAFLRALADNECIVRNNSLTQDVNNLPNIISLTICGIEAEALLLLMDADGVCISAASACSAGSLRPSHVLTAIGMSEEDAKSTIRISLGDTNTQGEMVEAARLLAKNVRRLKSMYNLGGLS